jgi:hypothetical protein
MMGASGETALTWGVLAPGTVVQKAEPLFPRIETKEEN